MLEARLPLELERDIFELAARSSPTHIPDLMLVAQRVKTWIEPILYRVIILADHPGNLRITWGTLCQLADSKPYAFWRDTVRDLLISSRYVADVPGILAACNGVTNLGLRNTIGPECLPPLQALPIVRLFADIRPLFGGCKVDFAHPLFAQLTHLGVADWLSDTDFAAWADGLASLPCLTHLSFHNRHHARLFRLLLDACPHLAALVVCVSNAQYLEVLRCRSAFFADDVRAVIIVVASSCADWQAGARGEPDYWERADRFIRRRRQGEVSAEMYVVD